MPRWKLSLYAFSFWSGMPLGYVYERALDTGQIEYGLADQIAMGTFLIWAVTASIVDLYYMLALMRVLWQVELIADAIGEELGRIHLRLAVELVQVALLALWAFAGPTWIMAVLLGLLQMVSGYLLARSTLAVVRASRECE